jgi:NADPH:quinone reductase-like Zn-dependent oxidoreductase
MRLFHFSDDAGIECFVPRPVAVPSQRAAGMDWLNGPLVWAIDELDGKVALVTGASSGIGQAVAVALAKAGASVGVGGRSEASLAETLGRIDARHGRALGVAGV